MKPFFIYEQSAWPGFTWSDPAVLPAVARARYAQGRHVGHMEHMGRAASARARLEAHASEAIASSAIEGERLDPVEVRSSVALRLGLDTPPRPAPAPGPGRATDGVVAMTMDAVQNAAIPLSETRLLGWHSGLFPDGLSGLRRITTGAWRTDAGGPMRVVSGPVGRERVHFEAPASERLPTEMQRFLGWFETDPEWDPLLTAAIAHLWFVTIHPFDDGNGRIARAITDMALARSEPVESRGYSLSAGLLARREAYYAQLESAQRGGLDVTAWLVWFLETYEQTVRAAGAAIETERRAEDVRRRASVAGANPRQQKVIERLLRDFEGPLTNAKYVKIARCSSDTALRDLRHLVEAGLVVRNSGGGRNASYQLVMTEPPASTSRPGDA